MKIIIVLLCSIIISSSVSGQTKQSLSGTWQGVGISFDDLYINFNEDSLRLPQSMKELLTDSASIAKALEPLHTMIKETVLVLNENGTYTAKFEGDIEDGFYMLTSDGRNIKFDNKNTTGDEVNSMSCKIKNELLYLTYKAPNGLEFILTLEKQK